MIKHFIWDFDGTLFNSYPPMVRAYYLALKDFGITMTEEEILLHMKTSVSYLNGLMKDRYSLGEAFFQRFHDLRVHHEEKLFEPFPKIPEVCKAICDRGGRNHIYTHRGASTHMYLDKYGLSMYFDEIVTAENEFSRKPDPEGILHILTKHKISPEEAVMIGDRELDIQSGQNAGVKGVFYSERPEYVCDIADHIIRDFEELLTLK